MTEIVQNVDVYGAVRILRLLADMIDEGSAEVVSFRSRPIPESGIGGVWVEVRRPREERTV